MAGDLERAERAALRDMLSAPAPAVAEAGGVELAEVAGATCAAVRSLPGLGEFNRALGLGLDEPAADASLDAVEAFFAGSPFVINLSPEAAPADLAQRLAARGYTPGYAWMKFCRTPDEEVSAPTDLRIVAVGPDRASDFADTVVAGFGMPPFLRELCAALPGREGWTCLVAYDGETACSAGAMFTDGESAWLGMAATLPAARGRGAQSAMLAARIRAAAAAGCRIVTTETGARQPGRPERSYRNILRAGFEEIYERPNWRSPA